MGNPKKILVTGGPVHAYLDAVKIITNKFRGGMMAQLADDLHQTGTSVTYLTAKGATKIPKWTEVIFHDGFQDYRDKVRDLAAKHDATILGAAVANLIPLNPWKGKFPSHNFKPGDRIPIDFTIAPRVIDDVKTHAPNTMLFGYKLLSGVSHEELIEAAWGVLRESKAQAIIANDASNLDAKFIVTRERGVHSLQANQLAGFIQAMLADTYWCSEPGIMFPPTPQEEAQLRDALTTFSATCDPTTFFPTHGELRFGSIAMRSQGGTFLTTSRGKNELASFTRFTTAPNNHVIYPSQGPKASLNAPLLARILQANPDVHCVVHGHVQWPNLPTQPYAPPGTVRDTDRDVSQPFNIEGHGCFLFPDPQMKVIQ